MTDSLDITRLLNDWADGDKEALETVTPVIYEELRKIARQVFSRERAGHTLQPTALVHEAYARLIGIDGEWQNRAHFYALAARMMRRLLVNHAKAARAEKRGGDAVMVTLNEDVAAGASRDENILDLDRALEALAANDQRKADVLELHYFGGLTHTQTGEALGISESTVRRELRVAKLWLKSSLAGDRPASD